MKKFNTIFAIIEYVLVTINAVWSVFSLMNGKIGLGVAQIFISLIALTAAIYFTLKANNE
jgi:hypothetical protein